MARKTRTPRRTATVRAARADSRFQADEETTGPAEMAGPAGSPGLAEMAGPAGCLGRAGSPAPAGAAQGVAVGTPRAAANSVEAGNPAARIRLAQVAGIPSAVVADRPATRPESPDGVGNPPPAAAGREPGPAVADTQDGAGSPVGPRAGPMAAWAVRRRTEGRRPPDRGFRRVEPVEVAQVAVAPHREPLILGRPAVVAAAPSDRRRSGSWTRRWANPNQRRDNLSRATAPAIDHNYKTKAFVDESLFHLRFAP